jgi:hypothetical protein
MISSWLGEMWLHGTFNICYQIEHIHNNYNNNSSSITLTTDLRSPFLAVLQFPFMYMPHLDMCHDNVDSNLHSPFNK